MQFQKQFLAKKNIKQHNVYKSVHARWSFAFSLGGNRYNISAFPQSLIIESRKYLVTNYQPTKGNPISLEKAN